MTKREQLIEQYEDALFALLMDSVAEEEGKQALELNERLKADPAARGAGVPHGGAVRQPFAGNLIEKGRKNLER